MESKFQFSQHIFQAMKLTGNGAKNVKSVLKVLLIIGAPKIAKALKIGFLEEDVISFFVDVVRKSVAHRKSTGKWARRQYRQNSSQKANRSFFPGEKRNDFVDHTLEALTKIPVKGDTNQDQFEKDAGIKTEGKLVLTEEELELNLIANLMLLFLAGT